MKTSWLNLICDPKDGTKLKLVNPTLKNGHVINGQLVGYNGNTYQIKQGIPILLTDKSQTTESVKSFAYEWDKWGYMYAKDNWLKNNIIPFLGNISAFKKKVVVDAGAGSGSQSLWIAEAGAKLVISLELSETIFNRHKKTVKNFKDIIFPIQCDISNPPIMIKPDILYCVNVLQHTKNPKITFNNLVALMNNKTILLFNVYNKEGFLGSKTVSIIRKLVKYLPLEIWRWLSFLISGTIYCLNRVNPKFIHFIYKDIHFSANFQELWLQIYDAFGSHLFQFTFTKKEQYSLFKKNRLKIKVKGEYGYLLVKNHDS